MDNNLETITGILITLKKEELESVIKTASALLGNNKTDKDFEEGDVFIFYKMLNKSHLNIYPPLSVIKRTTPNVFTRISNTVIFLNEYLEKMFQIHAERTKQEIKITRTHKLTIYGLFIDVMAAWFIEIDIPNTLKSAASNHSKFPALLDRQFPGYVRSGLIVSTVFNVRSSNPSGTHATKRT